MTITASVVESRTSGKGYTIALIGVLIWSTTAIFIRYLTAYQLIPPILLAAWRDLLASLTMLMALGFFNRRLLYLPKSQWGFILWYGLVLSLFNALWTLSVAFNGAAISVVLVYSSAAFTAVLARFLFRESLSFTKGLAVAASLCGCVLVAGALQPEMWRLNPLGILTGILSGLAMSGYSLFGKESARRGMSAWTALTYTFGIAALILFFGSRILPSFLGGVPAGESLLPVLENTGWAALILLAVGPTIGGYGLYTLSMSYLPASVVNLIATLEPTFTAAQAYFLLGERFSSGQVLGSLLILAGVVALRISERN
ncbi:MAG: DMT family transporter [Bellilinea sp.]|nr:DMT family transporter [Bellilinea sp.]